jgi:hypothetical protein
LTTGVDLAVIAWRSLDADERETAYHAIADLRLRENVGEESEGAQYITALRLIAGTLGHEPSPVEYDKTRKQLQADGHELPPRSRLVRHFGSWRLVKEALSLSETNTARRIEARFRYRKLGKVWRYTDASLSETMARCVADIGRPPRVAEFVHWRDRELQLAKARGDDTLHIPSPNPYRKRWQTWDDALLALGYSPEWIAERMDETRATVASPS